jgi:hypothetical protein
MMVMKLKVIRKALVVLAAMVVVWGLAQDGFASSTLTIAPSSDGVYALQGVGMDSVAAMDITVSYDPTTLASPQFTQGDMISGAMVAVNDTIPGTVRIGIVRTTPVKGTGVIATLTFTRKGDGSGRILAFKASISNIDGKSLPVIAQISQQSDTTADVTNTSTIKGELAATSFASAAPVGAELSAKLAGGPSGKSEDKGGLSAEQSSGTGTAMEPASVLQPTTVSAHASGITAASEQSGNKIQQFESVLKRFKNFKGERTAKAVIGLFAQDEMMSYHQQPAVALSDGKTPIRVTFISSTGEITAADVAVMGARVISMKKDPDYTNTWIAELLPEKDAYEASFAVSDGTLKRIYPLTVAPKIDMNLNRSGAMTEKDLGTYMSNQRKDVNKDGKKNYLDDYIYTANYLFVTKSLQTSVK